MYSGMKHKRKMRTWRSSSRTSHRSGGVHKRRKEIQFRGNKEIQARAYSTPNTPQHRAQQTSKKERQENKECFYATAGFPESVRNLNWIRKSIEKDSQEIDRSTDCC